MGKIVVAAAVLIALSLALLLTDLFSVSSKPEALLEAARNGQVDKVRRLLDNGVNPRTRDGWGDTAMMYAAVNGHRDVLAELMEAGASVDERSRMQRTPLMWAAYRGHTDVVQMLLDEGADPTLQDEEGATAVDLATAEQRRPIVDLLKPKSHRTDLPGP